MTGWGSAAVAFGGLTAPWQLVDPMPLEVVFTRAERLRSGAGRTLQHWAGRLAAKYAVLRLLDEPVTPEHLGAVEVLPLPAPLCGRTAACLHGHPPGVRLDGALDGREAPGARIRVSVSHTSDLAFAVALTSARLPEDDDLEAVTAWT
ncbi:phosphopantetheinyl transferase [Saccharothrix sp. ALI-22-I]|uniref:phosphopantetheinyl transferase n=1 Tax=Saccharothrix sp. ALI-22-I TaxID=1933778 RepID=UPI00097BE4E1|nr:phosphopantetheinyl transferase [Saccharothrix sp. ALI-22-I]ONI90734.1 phosphopantetheinyl transferase [Saccharothrix sp. ALI-22-I]